MYIADRLRQFREAKNLSQGDIEIRTGLHRCYVSRVENGHTVPSLETLEKLARAFEIPLYQLFYKGDELPPVPNSPLVGKTKGDWVFSGRGLRLFSKIRRAVSQMTDKDRQLLLCMAQKMSRRRRTGPASDPGSSVRHPRGGPNPR